MIAIPVGPPLPWVMVASPSYLEAHGQPAEPADLSNHRCIGMRTGTGAIYHWELGNGSDMRFINPNWSLVVSESALAIDIALGGGGIAYCLRDRVTHLIGDSRLSEVLPSWSSMGETFHIYYPSRRQQSEALRALISMLKRPNQSRTPSG